MRVPSRRTCGSALAVSVLALGVSGCAGSDDEASTASETPSGSTTADAGGDAAAPTGGDAVEPRTLLDRMRAAMGETTSARFTMEMTGGGQELTAEGAMSYAETGNEMDISMSLPTGGEVRVVAADGELFASLPGRTPEGTFVRIDPEDPAMGPLADQVESMDPLSSFDAFDAGLQEVTFVGEETVDGIEMERYRLEVDTAAAAEGQGEPSPAGVPETVVYDLWLDDEDHMRRMTFDLAGVEAVMTMSDWGEPVDVSAPPADKIVEVPSAGS
jgi:hypothetical protein